MTLRILCRAPGHLPYLNYVPSTHVITTPIYQAEAIRTETDTLYEANKETFEITKIRITEAEQIIIRTEQVQQVRVQSLLLKYN